LNKFGKVCTAQYIIKPVLGSLIPVLSMKVKQGTSLIELLFKDKPINNYMNENISPRAYLRCLLIEEGYPIK